MKVQDGILLRGGLFYQASKNMFFGKVDWEVCYRSMWGVTAFLRDPFEFCHFSRMHAWHEA